MSNGQQVYHTSGRIERVNDPVVTDSQAVPIAAGKMVMRESGEPEPHFVNFGLDPRSELRRQFE